MMGTKYTFYCDESRHDGPHAHKYMAIGALCVPSELRDRISKDLKHLRLEIGLRSELKWKKVSTLKLDAYKRIADFFVDQEHLRFRVIVVDQERVNLRLHKGDPELGFYTFYYEMLEKWIESGNEYLILLDFKQNKGAKHYNKLRDRLASTAIRVDARLKDLTVIDSSKTPLAQLCDLLTGAVAAACCADIAPASPKAQLADYLARRLGRTSLRIASLSPAPSKFNIFRIRLDDVL